MARLVAFGTLIFLVTGELIVDVNSKFLPVGKSPYLVLLRSQNGFTCAGTIIASNFVLTAAYCVLYPKDLYRIHAGTSVEKNGGSVHRIKRIIRASDFFDVDESPKPSTKNDVALVEVNPPFELDATRARIPLAKTIPRTIVEAHEEASVIGWFNVGGSDPEDSSYEIKSLKVPVFSEKWCSEFSIIVSFHSQNEICAGPLVANVNHNLLGGPLVLNETQFGIFSLSLDDRYPKIYMDVTRYLPWIQEHVPDVLLSDGEQ